LTTLVCSEANTPESHTIFDPLARTGPRKERPVGDEDHFKTMSGFTVISPVSNVRWVRQTVQTIIWNTDVNGVQLVFLEWSTISTATWTLITPEPVGNVGRYDWLIPGTVTLSTSGYFEVRVRSADSTYDQSSGYFYMLAEGNSGITSILNPTTVSTWFPSQIVDMQWTTTGNIQNVKLEWTKVSTISWLVINASAVNTGSYLWQVPANAASSVYYYIRITDTADSNDAVKSDFFQIAQGDLVGFSSPVHTDTWYVGDTYTIVWSSAGVVTTLDLDFTSCWTCDWLNIAHNIENSGSYDWTVPETAEIRDTTIIRITDKTPNGNSQQLESAQFRVRASSVQWQPALLLSCCLILMSIFSQF